MNETSRKILSMDDIRAGLSDMAENGDGAQRAQAYRMLMNMEGSTVTLPPPLAEEEIVERVGRILRGVGKDRTRSAYAFAFPSAATRSEVDPKLTYADATPAMIAESEKVTSLKDLYRRYPELKRNGILPGYPKSRSVIAKVEWCRRQALKILVERAIEARTSGHRAMMATDDNETIRGAKEGSSDYAATEEENL